MASPEAQERVEALEIARLALESKSQTAPKALARALLQAEERLQEIEKRWQEMDHPSASEFKAMKERLRLSQSRLREAEVARDTFKQVAKRHAARLLEAEERRARIEVYYQNSWGETETRLQDCEEENKRLRSHDHTAVDDCPACARAALDTDEKP